ncbi:MAG: hypothetical protein ACRC50_09255, partial [Gaiella sp.]
MRPDLLERYRALPLPTTRDEHWRFTDLAGFDPDAWVGAADGVAAGSPLSFVDLEAAGVATLDERGLEIVSAPEGVTFASLADDHPLVGSLVPPDDKLRAHNAAVWEHGLLVHVPAG